MLPRGYRIGDITLLRSKPAFERGDAEFKLDEAPYKILLFIVLQNLPPKERKKVTLEEIAVHIWPHEPETTFEVKKGRIYTLVSALRRSGITCLSHGTRDGYLLEEDVTIEDDTPAQVWLTSKSLVFASAVASAVTLVVTVFVRGFVTSFGASLTQPPQFGFVSGAFQAVFGSLVWTVPLSVALLYGWKRKITYEDWIAELSLPSLLGAGAAAGALGGLFVDIAILFAQQRETLYQASWIQSANSSAWSAFTVSKLGYAEPAMGIAVCSCCAAFLWSALRRDRWEDRSKASSSLSSFSDLLRLLSLTFKRVFLWTLLFIDLPVMGVGSIFYFVSHSNISLARFLGEGLIIGSAGVAFTIGLLTSISALARGFKVTLD